MNTWEAKDVRFLVVQYGKNRRPTQKKKGQSLLNGLKKCSGKTGRADNAFLLKSLLFSHDMLNLLCNMEGYTPYLKVRVLFPKLYGP